MSERNVAIVLAAGRGTRMQSRVQKQYLLIKGRPVLYYSLYQFQNCPFIDEVILVTGGKEVSYCREKIVEKYNFSKVKEIIPGGEQRYHSVYEGIKRISDCSYVFIHDGARPFIDQALLTRTYEAVKKYQACVAGMPVKDTIKISDSDGFAQSTPARNLVWSIQTPQVFRFPLIKEAYEKILQGDCVNITDDAMVMETAGDRKVKLVEGSYVNIKITTPEDLKIAEAFCS